MKKKQTASSSERSLNLSITYHLQRMLAPLFLLALLQVCYSFQFRLPTRKFSQLTSLNGVAEDWEKYFSADRNTKYQIISDPSMDGIAKAITAKYPTRFYHHPTKWAKFPDGTDNIEIGGFQPENRISGENVLFLASFHNNDVTLSQMSVMITLLQSLIQSLTIVLPFYPVGTHTYSYYFTMHNICIHIHTYTYY